MKHFGFICTKNGINKLVIVRAKNMNDANTLAEKFWFGSRRGDSIEIAFSSENLRTMSAMDSVEGLDDIEISI